MVSATERKKYAGYMAKFMLFRDGIIYPPTAIFDAAAIQTITSEEVMAFLNKLAFGTPTPGNNALSTAARFSYIKNVRQGILHYMPLEQIQWDPVSKTGNSTKLQESKQLLVDIKKMEC